MRFLRAYWKCLTQVWKDPALYVVIIISFIVGGLFSALVTGIFATFILPFIVLATRR